MEKAYLILFLIMMPVTLMLLTLVGFIRSVTARKDERKELHRYLVDSLQNEELTRVMAIYCYITAIDIYRAMIHRLLLRRRIEPPANWIHINIFLFGFNLILTEIVLLGWRLADNG